MPGMNQIKVKKLITLKEMLKKCELLRKLSKSSKMAEQYKRIERKYKHEIIVNKYCYQGLLTLETM